MGILYPRLAQATIYPHLHPLLPSNALDALSRIILLYYHVKYVGLL
jgi:hypothetical protein